MIKNITLKNLLSFGSEAVSVDLEQLNVFIGPNGSGKSNFIECFDLLRSTPLDILQPIRSGGGIQHWLWKDTETNLCPEASIDVELSNPQTEQCSLHYHLSFTEVNQRFEIITEKIKSTQNINDHIHSCVYYEYKNGNAYINTITENTERRLLIRSHINPRSSILARHRSYLRFPRLISLGHAFSKIRIYRQWQFARYSTRRTPQKTDLPNDYLLPDGSNLGLVLNKLSGTPSIKRSILNALQLLYDDIDDFGVQIEGGTVQIFLYEQSRAIPATRLSDGTLRFLCLLAILYNPIPSGLVCIEEPELGLHPDILPSLAKIIAEASNSMQLIVSTHSDILINELSTTPQSVLICERGIEGTSIKRLNANELRPWLENYALGQLWIRGDIGGTRW